MATRVWFDTRTPGQDLSPREEADCPGRPAAAGTEAIRRSAVTRAPPRPFA
jgi:hypothetical protein